jgi:hypothetical protein
MEGNKDRKEEVKTNLPIDHSRRTRTGGLWMPETHRNQRGEGGIGGGQGRASLVVCMQWRSSGTEAVKRLTDDNRRRLLQSQGSCCRASCTWNAHKYVCRAGDDVVCTAERVRRRRDCPDDGWPVGEPANAATSWADARAGQMWAPVRELLATVQ